MVTPISPCYHVLIVEDDLGLRTGLQDYFELEGFAVTTASDGEEALVRMRQAAGIDLVLLDNMLPKLSGFEVLDATRRLPGRPPVLMMTACGAPNQIMDGFNLGVDDYVVKPFSVDLLMARVRAVLRRHMPPALQPMTIHRFGDIEVNFSTHTAYRNGRPIHMTVLEFDLLLYLIQNEGRIITRDELLENVWHVPAEVETRTVDRHIASLRRKLEDQTTPTYIRTIYGRGYRFNRMG